LATGRRQLAQRLRRRGVTLSAGAVAALLAQHARACVPLSLLSRVVGSGTLSAASQAAPGLVSTLADSVMKGMLMRKLKVLSALVLCLVLTASLLVQRALLAQWADDKHDEAAKAALAAPKDAEAPAVRLDRDGEPLPPRALARLGSLHFRHGDSVGALAF